MSALATTAVTLPRGVGVAHLPLRFALERGGALEAAHLGFEITGDPAERCAPIVAVLGGISAGRRAHGEHGFWPNTVGPARAIDTERVRVLGFDFLGGPGASSGPRATARRLSLTPLDQARALACLLDELGIERLHAVVGASYGGQVALAFAAEYPTRLSRLVVLCAADRPHPLATAWRALQREIVRFARELGEPERGLELARQLAMTTYRSAGEFAARFDATPTFDDAGERRPRFAIEDYLAHHGRNFARRFGVDEFLTLSESIDLGVASVERIAAPTTLVGFDSDVLVPPWQLRALARTIGSNARHVEVATQFGHDGFLKESERLEPILRAALYGAEVRS